MFLKWDPIFKSSYIFELSDLRPSVAQVKDLLLHVVRNLLKSQIHSECVC